LFSASQPHIELGNAVAHLARTTPDVPPIVHELSSRAISWLALYIAWQPSSFAGAVLGVSLTGMNTVRMTSTLDVTLHAS